MTATALRPQARRDRALEALVIATMFGTALIVCGLALLAVTRDRAAVLAPVVVLTAVVTALWLMLLGRGNSAPFFETGGFLATVVLVYGLYPAIGFLVIGGHYTSDTDFRLQYYPPTPQQFGSILWWYAAFAGAFGAAYLVARGRGPIAVSTRRPPRAILPVAVLLFAAIKLSTAGISVAFGLSSGGYIDEYRAIAALPMVLRQLFVHVQGMVPAIFIVILVALFANFSRNRMWIATVLGAEFLGVLRHLGARTELFILLLSAAMLYHLCVRRLPLAWLVAGGTLALGLFIYLGYERARSQTYEGFSAVSMFSSANEFDAIFANAHDLKYVQGATGAFRGSPSLWAADFVALIPQQLLPFAKTNGALWYLSEFYPIQGSLGQGFAFGAVPEAIVGYGIPQLMFSAAILGLTFGMLHRFINHGRAGFFSVAAYVWLTVNSYQCFRNTTFSLLLLFVYHFVAPLLAIVVIASLVTRVRRGTRRALEAQQ